MICEYECRICSKIYRFDGHPNQFGLLMRKKLCCERKVQLTHWEFSPGSF